MSGDGGAHFGVPTGDDARRVIEVGEREALALLPGLERFFQFEGEDRRVRGRCVPCLLWSGWSGGAVVVRAIKPIAQEQDARERLTAEMFFQAGD